MVQRENRPPRRVYSLTQTGREELRRWLTTQLPPEEVRISWLVQVFFSGQLSDEEILATFERVAKQLRARLKRAHKIPEDSTAYIDAVGSPRESSFWMLTLDYRIKVMEAELAWIEETIQRLQPGTLQGRLARSREGAAHSAGFCQVCHEPALS